MDINSHDDRKGSLTDEEIVSLHADDLYAARIVVGLMTGVFFAGLLMYSLIFWVVW
jgi:hypothetical protein